MKFISLFTFLFAVSANAATLERDLVTCSFEGTSLSLYQGYTYQDFPRGAVRGEFTLVEELQVESKVVQSKLKVRRHYYVEENGALRRKGMVGAPLTRIGYASLGETITFSYTVFGNSGTYNWNIITDGKGSKINYSQSGDGYARRGYQNAVDCKIHNYTNVEAPELKLDDLSNDELYKVLNELERRYQRTVDPSTFPADKMSALKSELAEYVNNYDFQANPGVKEVRWSNGEGCGDLVQEGYYNRLKAITDPSGQDIGFHLDSLKCSSKLEYVRVFYDRETGEPEEEVSERDVYVRDLFFNNNYEMINKKSDLRITNW